MEQTAGFLEDVQNPLLQSTSLGARVSVLSTMEQNILSLLLYISVDLPIRNLLLLRQGMQCIQRSTR